MSTKELRRAEVLGRVRARTLRLVDVATLLGLSYRQVKRLWRRFRLQGAKALRHRSVGRLSNHRFPPETRRQDGVDSVEVQRLGGDALRPDACGRAPGE